MRKISLTTISLKFFALLLRKAALNSGNYRIILKNRRTNAKALAPCGAVWRRVVWRVAHKMWGVTCGGFFLVSGVAHVALWHTFGMKKTGKTLGFCNI